MAASILENFFIGSLIGFSLELVYRSVARRKVVWPSLFSVQMYGLTAMFLYLLHSSSLGLVYKVLIIFLVPSTLEFVTGLAFQIFGKAKPWDYSDKPLNIKGIVCLEFSFYWFLISLLYYFGVVLFY